MNFTKRPPRSASCRFILSLLAHHLLFFVAAAYKPLSDHFLGLVPTPGEEFDVHNGSVLAPILIPRVSGTENSTRVQEHFVNFFRTELPKWELIWQNSTSTTPVTGETPFRNLIFRREPPWVQPGQSNLLTLVAHYDSKYSPPGFVGATDSAAPCAILMHAARSIDKYVTQMHDEMAALGEGGRPDMDMGVQILFLDGEEAFVTWTATDSLYGARSLAEEWETTVNPAMAFYKHPINQISMFVLLDLLGEANPRLPSYIQTSHWAYESMATIEERMRKLRLLETQPRQRFLIDKGKTSNSFGPASIQDDHIPFMARGVPVLHMIPHFPAVWHTMNDDAAHLDMPTVRDWAKIVTAFALEWLDMMEVEPQEGMAKKGAEWES
ncbi:glutaminyl-peptide cyclotransferase [Thozetella sp. PMI_491]|nr:glutaminyl-peptide cyclotransferase [Thozetella sp. PMI_491]